MRDEFLITRGGEQYVLFAGDVRPSFCRCGCGRNTPLARRNECRRSHRKGEPLPYIHGHNRRNTGLSYDEDNGCWAWRLGKNVLVHRLVHEMAHGCIPQGHEVHHTCEVRACINPAHLVILTHTRHARRSSYTRLTSQQIKEIRHSEGITYRELARAYGISVTHTHDIKHGRRWRDA